MSRVNFVLSLHNHQPVGNFHELLEEACSRAYEPFIDMLERYPDIPLVLHYSGNLLEWIELHRPRLFGKIKALVARGQIELLGGGFYEPILVMLPQRDRIGQLRTYSQWLKAHLGAEVRGVWLAERVWEQSLVKTLHTAGVEFTVVDDSHFRHAGLEEGELDGYFLTEDEGELLKVFPGSERLRYTIPFERPEETIEHLGQLARTRENALAVYADDGEKFGSWPKTFKHVYEDGWLEDFFCTLQRNKTWINITTFREVLKHLSPRGRVYLPDASYREMMEWALPVKRIHQYEEVCRALGGQPWGELARRFIKGGCWRNFRVKYPEANQMYARMLEVSKKVAALDKATSLEAEQELYKAQCNDAYWHGIFGGLYLPHLRTAVFRHLIRAEILSNNQKAAHIETEDFDLDTEEEFKLSNPVLNAYLRPGRGGHLYELDYKPKGVNLINTLARREEAYHRKILSEKRNESEEGIKSIHELSPVVEEDLKRRLLYDAYQKEALIEHFFPTHTKLEDFVLGRQTEMADSLHSPYHVQTLERLGQIGLEMNRTGTLLGENLSLRIKKKVELNALDPVILISYGLENLSNKRIECTFAVEFNLSMSEGDSPRTYYLLGDKERAGHLATEGEFSHQKKLSLVDEGFGLMVTLTWSVYSNIWVLPIFTVSQSEVGFEKVYQGSTVLPRWNISLEPGESWNVEISKEITELGPFQVKKKVGNIEEL